MTAAQTKPSQGGNERNIWILGLVASVSPLSRTTLRLRSRRLCANVKTGTTLLTDGHRSYPGLADYRHDPRTVGKMAAHVVLPWVHRVFSLMKRWGLGTYHGLRRKHIDTYLNEFVFRYNRRFYRHVSFETMLGLASHHHPTSYWDIVGRDNPRKGVPTIRREPRRRRTANGMRADRSRPPEKVEPSPVSDSTRQP